MPATNRRFVPAAALFLLGLVLTLPGLGSSGLWDPWEPKYAQTAREMAERGDRIVPYYRDDPRLVKPPVTYWLIGASQAVAGYSELAARLPSAILASLCPALLALAFAWRGRLLEGWIAGAALLTGPQWLLQGRFATPDLPFAALLGSALAAVIVVAASPTGKRTRGTLVTLALVGLAMLTEWPRGLILPVWGVLGWGAFRLKPIWIATLATVAALYYFGQQSESAWWVLVSFSVALAGAVAVLLVEARVPPLRLALSLLLLVLIVAPWFAAVFHAEPEEAADRFLGYKHGLNLGESPGSHDGPLYRVLLLVSVGALPWVAASAIGLARGLRRSPKDRDELATLLSGAWIGGLLFFSLSEAQMGHFYPVLQPALAGLAGIGVVALVRRGGRLMAPVAAISFAIAWCVWRWGDPSVILETATVKTALFGLVDLSTPAVVVIALWMALLLAATIKGRERWALAAILPPAFFAAYLGWYAIPELGPKKSLRPMWDRYVEARSAGESLGSFGLAKDSSFYYSNNTVLRLSDQFYLLKYLGLPGSRFVILTRSDYRGLRNDPMLPPGEWEEFPVSHPTHVLVRFTRTSTSPQ
jgi:4-amino-4-deoxy-L-arabinose transferase-like glycosyltransferase